MKPHNFAIIFLPFVIILSNFTLLLFSDGFFHDRFEKYGTYDKISREEVDKELDDLQRYFVSSEETLDDDLLSGRERIHMLEVRSLMRKILFLWAALSLLLLLSLFLHPQWLRVLWWGGFIVLPLLFLLLIFSSNFANNFVAFHQIFFQDSSWLLSPDAVLITLFPQQFFEDFLSTLMIRSLFTGLLCMGLSWSLQRFKSSRRSVVR